MSLEDKPAKEAVEEIFATFEAVVVSELQRIEEMRKENTLPPPDAAQLRLSLRKFADALRIALKGVVPEFARESLHQEPGHPSQNEIIREAMAGAKDNPLLHDAVHAIGQAAETARTGLRNIKPEEPWRGVGKMFFLTLVCYFMLFLIDYSGNTAKRSECDQQGKIEAACAKKKTPAAPMNTDGTTQSIQTLPKDANRKSLPDKQTTAADTKTENKKELCTLIPGGSCDRIGYTIGTSPHEVGSAQGVALKTLTLLVNLLFVLSLSGLVLGILRAFGIRLGDKLVDMLLDGLNGDKSKAGAGSSEGGKTVVSGLSALLSAKGIIGATVAATMSIAAVNSYQQSTTKERELHSDNSSVVEKHFETIKEPVFPPANDDLKRVIELNSDLLKALEKIIEKNCQGKPEKCPTPEGNSSGAAIYSPSNNVSLFDEKAASALGKGFGVGIRQFFGDGNQDLRDRVKNLEIQNSNLEAKANGLQDQLAVHCIDMVKLEYDVKQDLKAIKENAVISHLPGHKGFKFDEIRVDCRRTFKSICDISANIDTELCKLLRDPIAPAKADKTGISGG